MDDEAKWAYLAGFTDGDGCITREAGRGGQYHYARVRWAQKESASHVLDWIAEFLRSNGLKVSGRNFSVARAGHKYPQRELGITNAADSRIALRRMLPYLVVKKTTALEALEILDYVHEMKQIHGNKYRVRMAHDGQSNGASCMFPDCTEPYYSKAKCKRHYDAVRRGTAEEPAA